MNKAKIQALASFINAATGEIEQSGSDVYTHYDAEFLVVTEDEADNWLASIIADELRDNSEDGMHAESIIKDMLENHERSEFLSSDNEENLENGYLIYRLN